MDRPTINEIYGPEGFAGYECAGCMVEVDMFDDISVEESICKAKQLLLNIIISNKEIHA